VLKFLSLNNKVIAPANIGRDNNNKIAVIKIAQTKIGILKRVRPGFLIFRIVDIKLIAPNNELIPAICKENIAQSTLLPE